MLSSDKGAVEPGTLGGDHIGLTVSDVEPVGRVERVERFVQIVWIRLSAAEAVRAEVASANEFELGQPDVVDDELDGRIVVVADEPDGRVISEPYLALDLDGTVSWGNGRYQSTRPISERVRSLLSRD